MTGCLFSLLMMCVPQVVDGVGESLDEYLTRLTRLGFSGGAVAIHNGELVLSKGYGWSNREQEIPFTEKTLFTIGSVTKPITGAAIVRLHMLGELDVNDSIENYFEDVPEDKTAIRLHHLLTHSSGLPGAIGHDFDLIERQPYIAAAMKTELMFAPGSSYEYSNVGYALLAAILEQTTEMSYEEFIREELLDPAEMSQTTYVLQRFDHAQLAHGYRGAESFGSFRDRPWREDGPSWHLMGNGGIHTTLPDIARWHRAIEEETMLSAMEYELQTQPHVDEGYGDSFYGYGWTIGESLRGTPVHFHTGGNPYFNSDLERYIDEDAMLFVTTNNGDFQADRVREQLERLLFGESIPMPPKVRDTTAEALQHWAGNYVLGESENILVEVAGETLRLLANGPRGMALLHTGVAGDPNAAKQLQEQFLAMVNGFTEFNIAVAQQLHPGQTEAQIRKFYEMVFPAPLESLANRISILAVLPAGTNQVDLYLRHEPSGEQIKLGCHRGQIVSADEAQGFQPYLEFFAMEPPTWTTFQIGRPQVRIQLEDGASGQTQMTLGKEKDIATRGA